MKIWYLLITKKFLFLTFLWWEIRFYFQPKSWWKDDIWCFSAFHDIPGLGKVLQDFAQCFTSWKRRKHRPLSFFSQDTQHAFVARSKSTAIGAEFQKFTKVWERSPQNWSKTFTGNLIIPWISFNQIVRHIFDAGQNSIFNDNVSLFTKSS